jgi:putative glycosyltransferase (TIGR04372 family)
MTGIGSVLLRKCRTVLADPLGAVQRIAETFCIYVVGMPLALAVRLARPVVSVRFGRVDCTRLGHFIGMCEVYSSGRRLGMHDGHRDFLYTTGRPMNAFLWRLFDRQLHFSTLARFADAANRKLPYSDRYIVDMVAADYEGLYSRMPSTVEPDERLQASGDAWLKSLGIDADRPIVLFANRDPAFLKRVDSNRDWTYHDYRDSSVTNLLPMAKTMVEKGYAAIRMGSDVVEPIAGIDPMIVDYASTAWSEDRDLYLAARCRIFIATTSGILDLGRLFRKPTGCANTVPFHSIIHFFKSATDLWIPKLFWSVADKRLMTFGEIAELKGDFSFSEQYEQAGIELIENTGDEIAGMALELEQIAEGTRSHDAEGEELYRRFWSLTLKGRPWEGQPEIALSFLRKHRDLLS